MNIGQAVAKRIKDLLAKHNKTQYGLAKDTLISHNTITSIVNAKNKTANLQSIFLISRAFGITVGEFFADPIFNGLDID